MSDSPRRLSGQLVWIDFGRKSSRARDVVTAERIILRGDELRMEFVEDGQHYEVALQKATDGSFRGTWERARAHVVEQRGQAECRLSKWVDSVPGMNPEWVKLEGTWLEGIDWYWTGRLENLATA